MATRRLPQPTPDEPTATPAVDDILDDEVILSSSPEGKPKTGKELYQALLDNGFIGMWKDRTDIGDSAEYARKLREEASERRRDRLNPSARD